LLVGSAVLCAGFAAQAQALSPADRAALEAGQNELRGKLRMPTGQEMRQVAPRLQLPRSAASAPAIDFSSIAKEYDPRNAGAKPAGDPSTGAHEPLDGLVVFVSLDMPQASLKRLVADAQRYGATLVLRGVKDKSIEATAKAIYALQGDLGERGAAWRIDPRLFQRFQVDSVPAHVLLDANSSIPGGCASDDCLRNLRYARVAGDISIEHALSSIAMADPPMRAMAEQRLAPARRGGFHQGGRAQ
jgi:conjugal transfer pilus assembly protein TrbC